MKKYDIVGLGSCLVDYIAKVPKIIGAEEKVNVRTVIRGFGGPTANNLVQAARLGLSVAQLGQIGDDDNGKYIMDSLRKERVDANFVTVIPGAESSYTWIVVDPGGDRAIYMHSNITSKITPKTVRERYGDAIKNARLFQSELCQIPLAAALEGAKIARENNVKVAVDYDVDAEIFIKKNKLGTEKELEELLSTTDVFKASFNVAAGIAKTDCLEEIAQKILLKGPFIAAITLGSEGCLLATAEKIVKTPAAECKIVDSTGAGDAFMGGLNYCLSRDWPLEKTAVFANACGSFCCQKFGAQQAGTLDEIDRFIKNARGVEKRRF